MTTAGSGGNTLAVAWTTYTPYGWPDPLLEVEVEVELQDTGRREFYEKARPPQAGERFPSGPQITHVRVRDRRARDVAVATSAAISAGIVALLWLPWLLWRRKHRRGPGGET